ncbi:ester cyclase [Undibacterium sp. Ji42W]|uniref:ester cyclase n=1 Tax=Undibacterium sp. Ji42W TaxID=3413039 RepID=UPI003BF0C0F3
MDNHARKEVVRRFNKEVIEEGSRASFEALMHTGFINHSAPTGAANDAESMWNTFQHILRPALSDLHVQIHDQLCEGEKVSTRKSITGKHTGTLLGIAPTGKSISIDIIDIVHIQDGRYLGHWGINTLPSVLAQLRDS